MLPRKRKKPPVDNECELGTYNNYASSAESVEDLKEDIFQLMSNHSDNSGDFSAGGLLVEHELSVVPLLNVKRYGILPFPLNKPLFEMVKSLFKASAENTYELNPKQFEIKNQKFVEQISSLVQDRVKSALGLEKYSIHGKICKLVVYEKGSKFDSKHGVTTEDDPSVFGSLIVQLPSVFNGGDLVVKHMKSSSVYKSSCPGSTTHCMFVASYTACPHQIKRISSGYRTVLVYSLHWKGSTTKPLPNSASTNAADLCKTLHQFIDSAEKPYICWALEGEYSTENIRSNSLNFLSGKDKRAFTRFKNCIDYERMQCGTVNWQLFIAYAGKSVYEITNEMCKGGRSCFHDCEMVAEERWYEFSQVIPLTENSNVQDVKTSFSPEEVIVNFQKMPEDHTDSEDSQSDEDDSDVEFWGEDNLGNECCVDPMDDGCFRTRFYRRQVLILQKTPHKSPALQLDSNMSRNGHDVIVIE